MLHYPASLLHLIEQLSKLPGIGTKSAERLAMYLLRASRQESQALADSIIRIKTDMQLCRRCFAFSDGELCRICSNPSRDDTLVCVVEQPADMAAIEKSGAFSGNYHILQGALSPIDGVGPANLRVKELLERTEGGNVREVVLATSTTVEGEATADYLSQKLKPHPVKVTRIASGVPMGGDLKYVDQVTLKRAMHTRHDIDTR